MSIYKKSSDSGSCELCGKEMGVFHHLYKCPGCGYAVCSTCLKKNPTCRCVNGVPPLNPEQQAKMDTLIEMGFPDYICIAALTKFNWNMENSIPWIIDNLATYPKPEIPKEIVKEEESEDTVSSNELDDVCDPMKWNSKEEEENDFFDKMPKKRSKSGSFMIGDPYLNGKYEIIEADEIINMVTSLCEKEADNLCLSPGNTSLLLKLFNWSVDKLEQNYFDDCDNDCCPICYNEGKMVSLSCGHYFCTDCWNDRISSMLTETGGDVINCLCMQQGCSHKIHYEIVKESCNDLTRKRFMYFLCKDFIKNRKSYVLCPVDTCGRAIHYFDISKIEVPIVCHCGQKFCFKCGREIHKPISCEQFIKWNELTSNDTESLKLLNTISKPCFHCGLHTERTDGCNHMTCRQCHGEWCWMCRGDWKTHGSSTGGFFKFDELREQNKKFLEYMDEFINYNTRIRLINEREIILKQIEDNIVKTTGKSCNEITLSAEVCKDAYSVVKYSFVYAYYIKETESIYKLFIYRQKKVIESVDQLWNLIRVESQFNFETLQQLRELIKSVKK
ncbi:RBR-type E3 ubiquitin transferase [Entamoeba marina]